MHRIDDAFNSDEKGKGRNLFFEQNTTVFS